MTTEPNTQPEITEVIPAAEGTVVEAIPAKTEATETSEVAAPESAPQNFISFDDFAKVELRIGKIISAEILEKSEKLLKLAVDFGEAAPRQVLSGIRKQFQDPAEITDRSFVFVTNLQPRPIMGLESQAMIVAGKDESGLGLMTPTIDLAPGTLLS